MNHPHLKGPIPGCPHFTWEEARCNHCGNLPEDPQTTINTASFLEKVRRFLGNRPIRIHSWFRCPVHNRNVGGVPNSRHLKGEAADIDVDGLTPRQVQAQLANHRDVVRGLGCYSTFTHVDRRPARSTWRGK